jgi:hypothetical protein
MTFELIYGNAALQLGIPRKLLFGKILIIIEVHDREYDYLQRILYSKRKMMAPSRW